MNEEEVNIKNVCRTCLSIDSNMIDIYNLDEKYEMPSYVEMLTTFLPLKILKGDGLPHLICSSCILQLKSAYKYFQECKRIDLILHKYIDRFKHRTNILENEIEEIGIKSEECFSNIDDQYNNEDTNSDDQKFEKNIPENINTELSLYQKNINLHVQSHAKLKQPNCHFCNKDFRNHKCREIHIVTEHLTELNKKCLNEAEFNNQICEQVISINGGINTSAIKHEKRANESKENNILVIQDSIIKCDAASVKSALQNYEKPKDKHGIGGNFVCHICSKAFEINSNLRKHIRAHDPDKPFYCPLRMCRKSFATENSLFLHVNLNHNIEGKEECRFCQKVFKHQRNLRSHLLKHMDDKMYKCKYCPKGFNFSHHLKSHERMHTKETPYLCSECGKGFTIKYNLKIHMSLHNNELPYKCPHCHEAFATRARYRTHKRSHPEECPYMCSHCGKTFPTKTKLTTHIQDIHNASEDGSIGSYKHSCGVCREIFETANLLTEHMKIHTLQYYCDICKKGFALPKSLEKHKNTHSTAKRTYMCIDCGDCFYRSEHLRSHVLRKHTNVKPHKCDVCQKSFVQNNDLTAHKRVHTGERPYVCQVCNRAFAQSNTLTAHIRTHTGERPYICKICNKGHCTAGTLAKHMKTHNKIKENGINI